MNELAAVSYTVFLQPELSTFTVEVDMSVVVEGSQGRVSNSDAWIKRTFGGSTGL